MVAVRLNNLLFTCVAEEALFGLSPAGHHPARSGLAGHSHHQPALFGVAHLARRPAAGVVRHPGERAYLPGLAFHLSRAAPGVPSCCTSCSTSPTWPCSPIRWPATSSLGNGAQQDKKCPHREVWGCWSAPKWSHRRSAEARRLLPPSPMIVQGELVGVLVAVEHLPGSRWNPPSPHLLEAQECRMVGEVLGLPLIPLPATCLFCTAMLTMPL